MLQACSGDTLLGWHDVALSARPALFAHCHALVCSVPALMGDASTQDVVWACKCTSAPARYSVLDHFAAAHSSSTASCRLCWSLLLPVAALRSDSVRQPSAGHQLRSALVGAPCMRGKCSAPVTRDLSLHGRHPCPLLPRKRYTSQHKLALHALRACCSSALAVHDFVVRSLIF